MPLGGAAPLLAAVAVPAAVRALSGAHPHQQHRAAWHAADVCADSSAFDENFDYNGYDIGTAAPAQSPEECCGRCAHTDSCAAWTWHNYSDHNCFLKTSSLGRTAVPGCVSGSAAAVPVPPAGPARWRASLVLGNMTQTEKLILVHGSPGGYVGNVPAIPRLGIPAINLEDGPQGVADGVTGVTAWPFLLTVAATWNTTAMRVYGAAMGAEQRGKGTNVMLGPGVCLTRVPTGGRNMEYLGEDPHLSYHMARANVEGIQSEGVVACAKHFLDNNQEGPAHNGRLKLSAEVPERAQHELYLPPFKGAVDGGVGSLMCSYNLINGTYACENGAALDILKSDDTKSGGLGFQGWVMSDWGATHSTVPSAMAGLDQEMSGSGYFGNALAQAVANGTVPQSRLDDMVLRILTGLFTAGVFDRHDYGNLTADVTSQQHSDLAKSVAAEATVLLRNMDNFLPLNASALQGKTVVVIGNENTVAGSGSGGVVGYALTTPTASISARLNGTGATVLNASFWNPNCGATQCEFQTPVVAQADIDRAVELARGADIAVVSVVTSSGEGYDRDSLGLGDSQNELVASVAAVCSSVVVAVRAPGAVVLPWLYTTTATLLQMLPGQASGDALAAVLFGDMEPSGRLPVSFPASDDRIDSWLPSASQFPGLEIPGGGAGGATWAANYSEGLLVGYRYYDAVGQAPAFPFGFGLSYTSFNFSSLSVAGSITPDNNASVMFDVTNTGERAGSAVPQLYLTFPASAGEPPQVLRGFDKVHLIPGEKRSISLPLSMADVSIWDTSQHQWTAVSGNFTVVLAEHSRAPVATVPLQVHLAK